MARISIFLFISLSLSRVALSQQVNVDSLLTILTKAKEDTGKATLYENLALAYRFTEPVKAIGYGKLGILLSKKLSFDKGIAGNSLRVSTAYAYSGKLDTGLLFLDTALMYTQKVGDLNRLGLIYLNRADYYRQKMNMKQALLDCDTALQYAERANNDDVRARVNQTMGAVYFRQQDYVAGISYSEKASTLYRKIGNMRMSSAVLNNLGLIYKERNEFDKSVNVLQQAIHITDSLKDITNLSIYYGNLSSVYIQKEDYSLALKHADKAMEYAVLQNNTGEIALAQSLKGNVFAKQKKFPEAIAVMHKALPVFQEIGDMDNVNISADILATSYAGLGDHTKAYEYTLIAREAGDSLAKWKYDDEIASMQTKFRVDEKDKEIQVLAMDKEIQHQKLNQQRFLIIASVALAVSALLGIWLAVNRNKLRQRMKELELRNQIAADLHDEVGSSLSSINMLSQMATQPGNESTQKDILERMRTNAKETMEKMGDIVWMIKPGESETASLKHRMERFAYEICSAKNIGLSLQLDALEKMKLSMEQRKNLYLIFKEALNNAVKYSGTEKIEISTGIENREFAMQVRDEGNGFDPLLVQKGNGLDNIRNRAAELGGTLMINTAPGDGTVIKLTMQIPG